MSTKQEIIIEDRLLLSDKKCKDENKETENVCVSPSLFRLIILVLCPPLAIFLHKGLAGILSVILCSLMTYFLYYFPGFIYAALIVFC